MVHEWLAPGVAPRGGKHVRQDLLHHLPVCLLVKRLHASQRHELESLGMCDVRRGGMVQVP